jgi:hypothetical protein
MRPQFADLLHLSSLSRLSLTLLPLAIPSPRLGRPHPPHPHFLLLDRLEARLLLISPPDPPDDTLSSTTLPTALLLPCHLPNHSLPFFTPARPLELRPFLQATCFPSASPNPTPSLDRPPPHTFSRFRCQALAPVLPPPPSPLTRPLPQTQSLSFRSSFPLPHLASTFPLTTGPPSSLLSSSTPLVASLSNPLRPGEAHSSLLFTRTSRWR